ITMHTYITLINACAVWPCNTTEQMCFGAYDCMSCLRITIEVINAYNAYQGAYLRIWKGECYTHFFTVVKKHFPS
uniref:Uncharacterized protein n=1 Tax=Amphimedon queenslandica TaxID=400682 RepID=A0A1X7TZN6_AMPQE